MNSNTKDFTEKARKIHGHTYNYDKVNYKNAIEKIIITCSLHGDFLQTPNNHLSRYGCKLCGKLKLKEKISDSLESFIEKAKKKHGDKYNYSKVEYKSSLENIIIICPVHGEFEQLPTNHLSLCDCPKCAIEQNTSNQKSNNEEFIKIATEKHGCKYDYSKIDYKGRDTKVIIICQKHGEFLQTPHNHKKGAGCPICKESHGEKLVRKFLIENNYQFEKQKRFETCRNKITLPFDFAVEIKNNLKLIEFHGIQHYKPMGFGNENKNERFARGLVNDKIKEDWCKENNIPLLIIPYDKIKRINGMLQEFLSN